MKITGPRSIFTSLFTPTIYFQLLLFLVPFISCVDPFTTEICSFAMCLLFAVCISSGRTAKRVFAIRCGRQRFIDGKERFAVCFYFHAWQRVLCRLYFFSRMAKISLPSIFLSRMAKWNFAICFYIADDKDSSLPSIFLFAEGKDSSR